MSQMKSSLQVLNPCETELTEKQGSNQFILISAFLFNATAVGWYDSSQVKEISAQGTRVTFRPVTSLGHQERRRVFREGSKF